MLKRLTATTGIAVLAALALTNPAQAGRSACPATNICAWNNSSWTGTMIAFQPSYIYQATLSHCENFDLTASQDAITSLASFNSAEPSVIFYKDKNCYDAPGVADTYTLAPALAQVQNLAGTGFNDTFSSIKVPNCC